MEIKERQIDQYIWDEEIIGKKMVFLSGPRQIGKTTYAKSLIKRRFPGDYFNWDNPQIRKNFTEDPFFFLKNYQAGEFLVIFDEIHKRHQWKDILKGACDSVDPDIRFLVTGSARLEWFRKSGDSLIGRYAHFHLLPLSLSELLNQNIKELWLCREDDWKDPTVSFLEWLEESKTQKNYRDTFEHLLQFGGFPEPAARASTRFLNKWKKDYITLLVTEDLRELSNIKDIDRMESIIRLLPEHTGNPLSISSLAGDIGSNYHTVKNSIQQLEKLWLLFMVPPWHKRLNRTIRKEPKYYFTNWIYIKDEGIRLENLIATHLLKACILWTDCGFGDAGLWYIRNFDGGEIDFLITLNNKPALLVESKTSRDRISKPARNFQKHIGVPLIQTVNRPGIYKKLDENTFILSIERFLSLIP